MDKQQQDKTALSLPRWVLMRSTVQRGHSIHLKLYISGFLLNVDILIGYYPTVGASLPLHFACPVINLPQNLARSDSELTFLTTSLPRGVVVSLQSAFGEALANGTDKSAITCLRWTRWTRTRDIPIRVWFTKQSAIAPLQQRKHRGPF